MPVDEAVVVEAFLGDKIWIGDFVIGGGNEAFDVGWVCKTGVVMPNEFGSVVTCPVEQFLAIYGD